MSGRRAAIARGACYAVASAAVTASFFVGYFQTAHDGVQFWLTFAAFQAALLSSLIPVRGVLPRQITVAATLLIVVNLFSPLLPLGEAVITLVPNVHRQVRVVGDLMPGFTGIQRITTDSQGYRTNGPVDYGQKHAGSLRVVAIGGSSTEDIFLDDAKTWTSLLAGRLAAVLNRPVEMINTGVSGLRAVHHLATLRDSERFSPDVAVFMMGINDWSRQIRESQLRGFERLMDDVARLSVTRTVLYRAIRAVHRKVGDLWGAGPPEGPIFEEDGADRGSHSLFRGDQRSLQISDVSADYQTSVDGIIEECRRRSIVCVFVDQATAYDPAIEPALKPRLWMTPPQEDYTLPLADLSQIARFYNTWLERKARATGTAFCDVAHDLPPTSESFFDDCHFNEHGAQRVAQILSACMEPILRSKLASWNDRKN